ncbi:MAG: hypothetical protein GKR89_10215 [Candidatus Latescibacteria bacterium]|nr:hypothetical protein [Candidatus Latescibacterota bacterium]
MSTGQRDFTGIKSFQQEVCSRLLRSGPEDDKTTESDMLPKSLIAGLFVVFGLWVGALQGQEIEDMTTVAVPPEIFDPPWMEARRQAQLEAATQYQVSTAFAFVDRRLESGIAFVHRIVDDAGKTYQAAHYDHGNGLAVADVDGDGLLDIYFSNQVGSNQLWRNLGGGRFEDITTKAGVALTQEVGVSVSFADIDNDGDPDLYATNLRAPNRLFENDGTGVFRDISAQSGLDYSGHSSGALFFDYNRDGLLDLFLTNVGRYTTEDKVAVVDDITTQGGETGPFYFYRAVSDAFGSHLKPERVERSLLYENMGGGRFADVTEARQLLDTGYAGDATVIDANRDGWPDLYVLNMQGDDSYYENAGGQYFIDKSRQLFPQTPWGSMGVKVFDFDNDGAQDMYISDMHSDMSEDVGPELEKQKSTMKWPASFLATQGTSLFGNAFFRGDEDSSFAEVSDAIGAENYWPWGLSVGDLNADGWTDAFLASSMNYPFRYGVNSVLLNEKGQRLVDSEFVLGVEPRRDGRTAVPWFELDCGEADYQHKDCEFQSGRVVVWGALGSRSSVVFDIDQDGDLDIVTNDFNSAPLVLVSDLAERGEGPRFLKIVLRGQRSNRDGLGAQVKLYAGGQVQTVIHDGKSGYLSQSSLPLYFGLGQETAAERVEIHWPSGIIQVVEGPLEAGQTLEIEERANPEQGMGGAPEKASEKAAFQVGSQAYHVYPGGDIQAALDAAAADPRRQLVQVHEGTYRPRGPGQALIWFNGRHDGLTVEAVGEVVLTAANAQVADKEAASFPAVVNHVVYFGDGIGRDTVLRGFAITGANNFVTLSDEPVNIQPDTGLPQLRKGPFFYADGGGIKIFGRSYPTIENVQVYDNYTSPCGGGVSVEHRGFNDRAVLFKNCIFRDNRTQVTGAAVDLLQGSAAVLENCLFVGNIANTGIDVVGIKSGHQHNQEHGSGALTVFPQSRVEVRRCTFTGNWNGVDDHGTGNRYSDSIFWMNTAGGGISPGRRYEIDLLDGSGLAGCFIYGEIADLRGAIDMAVNTVSPFDPDFDHDYRPSAPELAQVGYRPVGRSE